MLLSKSNEPESSRNRDVRISKGKARQPYEFGCKVGLTATNREGLFIAAKAFGGDPYDGKADVMISGRNRGLTPIMKRELNRRSAVESMIGHAKNDGRLGRNWLLGTAGDKINATLAAGHNLRLVLKHLAFLCPTHRCVLRSLMKGLQTSPQHETRSVFPDICLKVLELTTSKA
jgi:IS5 family transposase